MQDAEPYQASVQRSEGDAEAQQNESGLNAEVQQHESEDRLGDPATSSPTAVGGRDGTEAEAVNREMTHSESGEGIRTDTALMQARKGTCRMLLKDIRA